MNKKTMSSERKMTNADGPHSRHGVLTRRMARELRLKKEEVMADKVEEELKKKDEEEEEKKEETQEGVEAKEPTVIESPDQNADGVNAAAEEVPVGPQPPPAADTSEEDMASVLNLSQYGWTPWRSKEEQYLWFDGDFSSGLGNPYGDFFDNLSFPSKISGRPLDHRDEALFQKMCILRMMASIFYRIDDLPDYLIVWSVSRRKHIWARKCKEEDQRSSSRRMARELQMKEENGKRASSKAGNKNSSERRMMLNANGFHSGHAVLTRRVLELIKQRRKQKKLRKKDDDDDEGRRIPKWAWSFDPVNGKRASNEEGVDVPLGPKPPRAADTYEWGGLPGEQGGTGFVVWRGISSGLGKFYLGGLNNLQSLPLIVFSLNAYNLKWYPSRL
ncbi:hypothetical protein D8674_034788 [Pyrus ussuriensis x Pyrus communis]|uniref:Uncharacterized protein n=1 Tax=Pyrus ussuriensis x Pyrus communis TaxID=2448454 RepID=A0A5N5GG59_9ROSA|nr:hypothetical protein D8674_034788 [Pyrus ussuriensis x Pyrus communis]